VLAAFFNDERIEGLINDFSKAPVLNTTNLWLLAGIIVDQFYVTVNYIAPKISIRIDQTAGGSVNSERYFT